MPVTGQKIELITSLQDLLPLEGEWNALLQQSSADHLFLTWEYVSTWLAVYGRSGQLCTLISRDREGRLTGIAPLIIRQGHGPGRRALRHLTLLGGECDSTAEYGDFIIAPGLERALSEAFCRRLLAERGLRWDALRFGYVRTGSEAMQTAWRTLTQHLAEPAAPRQHRTWAARLGDSWESYEQTCLSGHRRSQLRRLWKKLQTTGRVRVLEAGRDTPVDDAMEHLVSLNLNRWDEAGAAFQTEEFRTFHRMLARKLAEKGWLSLLLLEVDGVLISARYDFAYGGVLSLFQSGWQRAFAEYSPGQLLLSHTVRHAISRGLHTMDFMTGDSPYKASWAVPGVMLGDVEICNPRSLRGRAAFAVRRTISRFRTLAESAAPAAATLQFPQP